MLAGDSKRILVIEDQELAVRMLDAALTLEGFCVDTAALGSEGVRRAQETAYHAIIVGAGLPDMSRFEVMTRLRTADVEAPIQFVSIQSGDYGSAPTLCLSACSLAAELNRNFRN